MTNRSAFVTGASRGIGLACAHALAGANALVEIEPWDGSTEHLADAFAAGKPAPKAKRAAKVPPTLVPAK